MSDRGEVRKLTPEEEAAEKAMRATVHKWMGIAATLLTVVAIVVAYWRLSATLKSSGLGISFGEAFGIGMSAVPWVIIAVVLAVLFSLGTTRIMLALEWVWKRVFKRSRT